jgi:predicted RNA methylase
LAGDIKKVVFDFGCGAGRLAIGSRLLGAKLVVVVDIDKELIKIARSNVIKFKKKLKIALVRCDIKNFFRKCDLLIQKHPFGVKKIRHMYGLFSA